MIDVERIDDKLYKSVYGIPRDDDYNEIWNEIKSNPKILREAVKVVRDKFDENDTVKGITICNAMLIDYEKVDISFIGFKISKGTHNIKIIYTAPFQKISKFLSLIGSILFICILCKEHKKSTH